MTALEDALPGLDEHRRRLDPLSMRQLLGRKDRFTEFSAKAGDLFLDYSKNKIDRDAFAALIALAGASGVAEKKNAMFAGVPINTTEGRAVMHVALRADSGAVFEVNGTDIMPGIRSELDRMTAFAEGVRSGEIVGEGEGFVDVVNIGIGGSDLGPAMATLALRPYHDGPRLHFVSNVDGAHLADTLDGLDPRRTLFLVASKTFTTTETMTNAMTARNWLAAVLGDDAVGGHFAAMSAAVDKATAFGIGPDRIFGFGDWVGGRYSLWSTIGLPLTIAIGDAEFREFLGGARIMDTHFVGTPFGANLPCLLALVGIWNRNVCNYPAIAILPYDQRLARLPAYLQQLDMESNGKRVAIGGDATSFATGPLVFGEPGTNGQHAFYQFLHQGTDVTPCDFLVAAEGHEGWPEHHDQLVASCLAQSEALSWGKTQDEVISELVAGGYSAEEAATLAPHKTFPGDRPSNTILYRKLTPSVLGQLIALYEHKVFVQGAVWSIDSFDQWGVELGKQLATGLVDAVRSGRRAEDADASTAGLLGQIARFRRETSSD
jgi:glucose-6-phosphate isomerase